jgi:hypothetical protein
LRRAIDESEVVITSHTVAEHRINLAADPDLLVPDLADDRKQHWRMPRPFRTGLPQQLESVGGLQRAQFGAMRENGRADLVAA